MNKLPGPKTTMSASIIAETTFRAALASLLSFVLQTYTRSMVLRSIAILDSPTAVVPSLKTACKVKGVSEEG